MLCSAVGIRPFGYRVLVTPYTMYPNPLAQLGYGLARSGGASLATASGGVAYLPAASDAAELGRSVRYIVTGEPFKQSAELTGEPIEMKA